MHRIWQISLLVVTANTIAALESATNSNLTWLERERTFSDTTQQKFVMKTRCNGGTYLFGRLTKKIGCTDLVFMPLIIWSTSQEKYYSGTSLNELQQCVISGDCEFYSTSDVTNMAPTVSGNDPSCKPADLKSNTDYDAFHIRLDPGVMFLSNNDFCFGKLHSGEYPFVCCIASIGNFPAETAKIENLPYAMNLWVEDNKSNLKHDALNYFKQHNTTPNFKQHNTKSEMEQEMEEHEMEEAPKKKSSQMGTIRFEESPGRLEEYKGDILQMTLVSQAVMDEAKAQVPLNLNGTRCNYKNYYTSNAADQFFVELCYVPL